MVAYGIFPEYRIKSNECLIGIKIPKIKQFTSGRTSILKNDLAGMSLRPTLILFITQIFS